MPFSSFLVKVANPAGPRGGEPKAHRRPPEATPRQGPQPFWPPWQRYCKHRLSEVGKMVHWETYLRASGPGRGRMYVTDQLLVRGEL